MKKSEIKKLQKYLNGMRFIRFEEGDFDPVQIKLKDEPSWLAESRKRMQIQIDAIVEYQEKIAELEAKQEGFKAVLLKYMNEHTTNYTYED